MNQRTTGQHVLPRFSLKGFTAFKQREQEYTYLFRRSNLRGVPANIDDVAKRRLFYGEPGVTGIEDALAAEEQKFAPAVWRTIEARKLLDTDREILFHLIANLTIRTHHLRSGISSQVEDLFHVVKDAFTGEQAARIMHRILVEDPRLIRNTIRSAIRDIPSFPREPALHLMFDRQIEQSLLRYLESGNVPLGSQVDALMAAVARHLDWDEIAATSHIQTLQKDLTPAARVEVCRNLLWSVVCLPPRSVILGDFGPLGRSSETGEYRPLSVLGKNLDQILVPLSHDLVLAGNVIGPCDFDPDSLRRNVAAMSAEFFVAAQNTEQEEELHRLIGTRSSLLTDEEAAHIKGSLFDGKGVPVELARNHSVSVRVSTDGEPTRKNEAVRDLQAIARFIEESGTEAGVTMETRLTLLVTDDLRTSVQTTGRNYGQDSDIRMDGRTVPIWSTTLFATSRPPLDATIIIDGGLWDNDNTDLVVARLQLVLSQIASALMAGSRKAAGDERASIDSPKFADELDHLAQEVLDIHDAQRLASAMLSYFVLATDADGESASPADLLAEAYVGPIRDLLRRIGEIVDHNVQPYREHRARLDDILPATCPVVRELMILLATMLGIASQRLIASLPQALDSIPGYFEYLKDDWEELVDAFGTQERHVAQHSIVGIARGVLARMGLYVDDLGDGRRDLMVGTPRRIGSIHGLATEDQGTA